MISTCNYHLFKLFSKFYSEVTQPILIRDKTSLTDASILQLHISSALVWPMFIIITGIPRTCACLINLYPDQTNNELPQTSTPSLSPNFEQRSSTTFLLTLSPKKTTSGFSVPPQDSQAGTIKFCMASSLMLASASGLTSMTSADQFLFSSSKRDCNFSLQTTSPQFRHLTLPVK